jgi:hypothetical protein|tara:strand:- start:1534 stop:1734 length:201 start_codon:yes stop_codon:yes gene_type:complete
MTDGNLLTVAQAAVRLFGSDDRSNYVRTLHLVNSGKIHHLKIGRKILINREVIDQVGKPPSHNQAP